MTKYVLTKHSPNKAPRILIIRLSAIGDVVMASGIISAIRSVHPNAYIAWLVEPMVADLLRDNDQLDEVIIWQRPEWKKLWRQRKYGQVLKALRVCVRRLRDEQFDIALDMQGLLKSGFWAFASGAKRRIGLGSKEGSQWLMTETVPRPADDPRISSEYIQLAEHLGASASRFQMALPIPMERKNGVSEQAQALGLEDGKPVLAACVYTTRPQKHWFDDYWCRLFQLAHSEGWQIIVLGGPGDAQKADALIAQSAVPAINLCGKTRLLEAAEYIDRSDLLIGVDTGLTHMGIAKNTPTIALFGSTRPYSETPRDNVKVLYSTLECAPCRRHPTCDGAFTCMRNHEPERVWQQAKQLLPFELSM